MADSKWIIMCSFLLSVLCNCQEISLLNLEETGIISCPSDNFTAVPDDIVRMRAGEPDKEICLDPNYTPNHGYAYQRPRPIPFYHTVSCESQSPRLSRQLLMSREDIQHFKGLGGKFCQEISNSSDGNEQLLFGINLADVSREELNFSLTLVCRGVGTTGGSDVETSTLIEPRNTTSLRFIPQGQNSNVTTEKGKRVKIAVLVALPDELENVTTLWSDSRIECGPDADIDFPKCVYTSQVGKQVTWSCSITTNNSDVYTFQHRGKLYVVRLTVHDPSHSSPPQDFTVITVVLAEIALFIVMGILIFAITTGICCYNRKFYDIEFCTPGCHCPLKDVRKNVLDSNWQLTRGNVENERLDILSEPSQDCTPLESPNQPSSTITNAKKGRTKEDPGVVVGEIEMTSSPAYEIVKLATPLDKPIQVESRFDDRRSDTPSLVHNEVEMSEVVITRTRTGSTAVTTSLASPPSSMYNNQSIGQCNNLSRTTTHQPSSSVSSDSSGITPGTSDKWWVLGGAHTIVVESCGGEWSLSPFSGKRGGETSCAVLTAPSGVVEEGIELPVEYCVILDGPFALPSNYVRVSVAVYLNCDETLLRKPLEVKLCHWAAPDEENDSHFSDKLSFLKAPHKVVEGQDSHHFKLIEGAEFHTSTSTGILRLKDHFCLICIACERSGPQDERVNKRCYAMLWEGEEEDSIQQFRIVVMYAVPSWKQAAREHYLSEKKGRLKYSEVREFVFTKDCLLHLGIAEDKGNDWMLLQLKTMLYQEDLSLSNFTEMECEDKIDKVESGLYPPAMIFDVGYELPPSKESRIKFLKASLHGVKNELNFSFPVLENPKMCCKRKLGSDISKKYQLDPVSLEDYVIPKMSDKWKEFGIRLGIQDTMLGSIYKSNFGNTVDCCRAVLHHWMSSSSREVSWDKVIQVMKDCERKLQASELEDHLSEKGSMVESLSSEFEE